jgi:hypothetical protein
MTNSGELIAINGVIVVNDTAENTTHADSYYVAEDTVIASIKVNGLVTDVKATYISAPATAVKGGVLITPQIRCILFRNNFNKWLCSSYLKVVLCTVMDIDIIAV